MPGSPTYPVSVVMEGLALNITVTTTAQHMNFGLIGARKELPSLQRLLTHPRPRWRSWRRPTSPGRSKRWMPGQNSAVTGRVPARRTCVGRNLPHSAAFNGPSDLTVSYRRVSSLAIRHADHGHWLGNPGSAGMGEVLPLRSRRHPQRPSPAARVCALSPARRTSGSTNRKVGRRP